MELTVADRWTCMSLYIQANGNDSLKWLKFILGGTKPVLRLLWIRHTSTFRFFSTNCLTQTLRNAHLWKAREGACSLQVTPSPSTCLIWGIWTGPVGDIHKEPPEVLLHHLKLYWGFLFLAPDNIVYIRTNSIYAAWSLPGTPQVDVFDYAVEIKFLQGRSLSIFGKFNFIVLLILFFSSWTTY